ncbi:hypothetical protein BKA69DRAFT_837894 [Paraphysoderma sedebokerense]|nr:hypothetical protein BKA69DRAFT_837894 [Paraphysoderma sedebokerense]
MSGTNIDDITLDETEVSVLKKIFHTGNTISIFLCFIACIIFLYGRKIDAAFSKRKVTVLSVLICLSDAFCHFMSETLSFSPGPPSNSSVCDFLMWGYAFTSLCVMGFVLGINLHLQMVFLSNSATSEGLNIRKHSITVMAISTIIAAIPIGFKGYSWSTAENLCWFNFELNPSTALILQWTCLYGWIALTWLSSCFTVFAVLRKLITTNNLINFKSSNDGSGSKKSSEATKSNTSPSLTVSGGLGVTQTTGMGGVQKIDTGRVASRLVLYPLTLLLCQGTMIIVETYAIATGEYRFPVYITEYFIFSAQGALDAIVFLTDKALIEAIKNHVTQKFGIGIDGTMDV